MSVGLCFYICLLQALSNPLYIFTCMLIYFSLCYTKRFIFTLRRLEEKMGIEPLFTPAEFVRLTFHLFLSHL